MLTRIGNKVTVGRPLCNVLRIGRPLEGGGSFLRDWTVYGKSEVVGSSVLGVGDEYPWNQLVNHSYYSTQTINGVTFTRNADGSITVDGTATANALFLVANIYWQVSHKYLIVGCPNGGSSTTYQITANGGLFFEYGGGRVFTCATIDNRYAQIKITNGQTINGLVFRPQAFDLTAIFGAGNEPSTVDEFKAWLVKVGKMSKVTDDIPYFPYDAGSTFTSLPIVASSRNLWDGYMEVGYINDNTGAVVPYSANSRCTGFIEVIGGVTYFVKTDAPNSRWGAWYDANKNYVSGFAYSSGIAVAPANARYFRMTVSYNGNGDPSTFCFNISDALDGTYTPHQSQRFPLVISSPLHGIGDVRDIMRYSDHGITRKFGVVDLGTLDYSYVSAGGGRFQSLTTIAVKNTQATETANILCATMRTGTANEVYQGRKDIAISGRGVWVWANGRTDYTAFKAEMQGVLLVYELATPTFEPVTLPKLPAYRDGTVLYTDTQVHGDTIAGEAPVGFSLLPPVTMTPPTGDADTNEQTDDTATE